MVAGGARGEHVIDEDCLAPVDPRWGRRERACFRAEGTLKVGKPLLASKVGLTGSGKKSDQAFDHRDAQQFSRYDGDLVGLIEAAFTLSQLVGGHRNEDGIVQAADTEFIADRGGDHSAKRVAQPALLLVFQPMDHVAGHSCVAVTRGSEVEGEAALSAVAASKWCI